MTFLCDQAEAVVQSTALVLLAWRGWVESVKDQTRAWPVLVVRAAPRGSKPMWGGFLPQFLGFQVCQEMKSVLMREVRARMARSLESRTR